MESPILTRVVKSMPKDQVHATVNQYRSWYDEASGGDVKTRRAHYAELVKSYHDLATDFYEYGWGQSFHFAPRHKRETFEASLARYEIYLAHRLGLCAGMHVLDVGCGVGGPMRTIARFAGANVTGINNNDYQITRARMYNREARLEDRCDFIRADFLAIPVSDGSFDAAYDIESTCHAPDLGAAYGEVFRVLRPGGGFAGYEWCLTDRFDGANLEHQAIKKGIEEGAAIPELFQRRDVLAALVDAGFEIVDHYDAALTADPETPWYDALKGSYVALKAFRRTLPGRWFTHAMVRMLETLGVAPRGSTAISTVLNIAADALIRGGETGSFTPMYFYYARKPAE